MYNAINQQLDEARQRVFRSQKINAMLEELEKQKKIINRKASEFKEILDKEEVDVEQLEGKSMAHLFFSILGNLDKKLQKEQQEALAARLKYDQAIRDLEGIEYEISKIKPEKSQYDGAESLYLELYEKKKEQLLQTHSGTAKKMLMLSEQVSTDQNIIRETQEAVRAGRNVLEYLESTIESLNSAAGWGTWDLLGGGLLADLAKHDHIDDAQREAERAQNALNNFRTELADIKIENTINIEIDEFGKFADFFFDGLIADWCMQSRINESQESVENVRNQVKKVLIKLETMESDLELQIGQCEKEINNLIESAV